ncbi:gamma-glutamylcyclotransferase-like [Mercenaria mercenaria]|uniref:gamma-glutamylcyclotransferase-like n=1 Tax=Mercenaria mercenaria TaxID=6596 RepID=UPI00234EE2A2|nr:gamma-glutamylcyclotransferase-like [Mercenaria mercenaria]
MTFLYFAYGSNLLQQRLHMGNPSARFVAIGELKDHTLAFSCLGMKPERMRWRGGAASIREDPTSSVWGCVWRLGNEHSNTLDRQELVYDSKNVTVTSLDGREYTCRTYQLPASYFEDEGPNNRPSPMYLDIIIKGAIQNKLPEDYVHFLRTVETNDLLDNDLEIYADILKRVNEES